MSGTALRSPTVLSEAAGGVRVPTWETAESYARACGASDEQVRGIRTRWLAAMDSRPEESAADGSAPAAESEPESEPEAGPEPAPGLAPEPALAGPARRPRRIGLIAAAVVLVAAGVGAGSWALLRTPSDSSYDQAVPKPAETPLIIGPVVDGADPRDTGCSLDAGVVTLGPVEVDYQGQPAGYAQLRYSPKCHAAWPRFEPFAKAAIPAGVVVHVDVVRPGDRLREAFAAPYVGEPVFGNVLTSTSYCTYAAVWLSDPADTKDAGAPESRTFCFRGLTPMQPAPASGTT